MKTKPIPITVLALLTLLSIKLQGQDSTNFPTIGEVLRFDRKVDSLITKDAKIEVLASGFAWGEGPVWVKDGGFLLFSDVHRNQIVKWTEGVGAEVYLEPSGYTGHGTYSLGLGSNGLAIDDEGRLISCEHGDRRLSTMVFGEGKRTLVDNYQGKRFNSPNDIAIGRTGRIYFTDPTYGLPNRETDPTREIDFAGVYLLDRAGNVSLITDELRFPNGVELSHDERTLYVAQSDPDNPIVMAYPLDNNGEAGKETLFFDAKPHRHLGEGNPDGLKIDQQGNLWVTGNGGVMIIDPRGKLIGHLSTGERTANCAWGDNGSTLYITADMYLCRIKTKVTGREF